MTALSRHHDAYWTSTADNDYIDIDDDDTRGVSCLLRSSAMPCVWSFLRVTLVAPESSHKYTHSRHKCMHPYTISQAHTARSNVRVLLHDVNLSLDNMKKENNICLFVHYVATDRASMSV